MCCLAIEQHVSTQSSALRLSSTFTQCCHEIALNHTDVCIGPTWPTEKRQYDLGTYGLAFTQGKSKRRAE